jgi:uncharacterized membrane protein YgcG
VKLLEAMAQHQPKLFAAFLPPDGLLRLLRFAERAAPPMSPADIRRSAVTAAACASRFTPPEGHVSASAISKERMLAAHRVLLDLMQCARDDHQTVEHALRCLYNTLGPSRCAQSFRTLDDGLGPGRNVTFGGLAPGHAGRSLVERMHARTQGPLAPDANLGGAPQLLFMRGGSGSRGWPRGGGRGGGGGPGGGRGGGGGGLEVNFGAGARAAAAAIAGAGERR